jgi:CDP-diacylglycerol---glycerol-3-phosphate 3-phosphatidyltransferase
MIYSIPNIVTFSRLLLIPLLVFFYSMPYFWAKWAVAIVFFMSAVGDWLDGFLARYLSQSSRLGAFLDPVVDKLLVTTGLVLLLKEHNDVWFLLATLVIVGREIIISALREWMALCGASATVAVSWVGKLKTVLQTAAITILLLPVPVSWNTLILPVGYMALLLATILTLWSMVVYLQRAWPLLVRSVS